MVRLFFLNSGEDPLVLVDTGCTWHMVMERQHAETEGLQPTGLSESATVASGEAHVFEIWNARIRWFGAERKIRVHVPVRPEVKRPEQSRRVPADDETVALIGTALLKDTHLAMDFRANTVRISRY
jgi:predicted aspartyl protease